MRYYAMDEPVPAELRLLDSTSYRADGLVYGAASFVLSRSFNVRRKLDGCSPM